LGLGRREGGQGFEQKINNPQTRHSKKIILPRDDDADLLQIKQDLIGNGLIEVTELNDVVSIETADPF